MAVTISASVGQGGGNSPVDVGKIQSLLNAASAKPPLAVDRVAGPKTIQAIKKFQASFLCVPDGRVDPGGMTLKKLNAAGSSAVSPEQSGNWSGDSSQWSEAKKLDSLNAEFRVKVAAVLQSLRAAGFQPKIFYGWRSVKVQAELVRQGHSKVSFSFHNAQTPDGRPNAYAADIIDTRWGWNAGAKLNGFWDALGTAAKSVGLYWGGDWTSFRDWAHIQHLPNSSLATVKSDSGL